jgi:WD40 repeat protein
MKKKVVLFAILLLIVSTSSYAQSLQLFNIDTTSFPNITGKFYAFDKDGNQITNISPTDFILTENGTPRNITNISCSQLTQPEILSSVLTIDVSGSMYGNSLAIAKKAAETWINAFPANGTECAITAFTENNYLVQDFTTDKAKLNNSLSNITAGGGTDFDAALKNPIAGGLLIADRGKHKKVIVLITDGFAAGNQDDIINLATTIGASIYCVTIGYECPDILKNVCTQTGGIYFENVVNEQQASDAFSQILQFAQGAKACDIEWMSENDCNELRNVELNMPSIVKTSNSKYYAPSDSKISLDIQPKGIGLGFVEPLTTKDTTVIIKAVNSDITIDNITLSNPLFSISDYGGNNPPFTITENEERTLTIRYSPLDSSFAFCRIEIEKNICGSEFLYLSSVFKGSKNQQTLKLTHPNGGEKFAVGTDTIITWEGILPSDTVSLEYSTNGGIDWITITDRATGLKYNWKAPNIASNNCLIRVRHLENVPKDIMTVGFGSLRSIALSPDGTKLAGGSCQGFVNIFDVNSGIIIDKIKSGNSCIWAISWSPEGDRLANGCSDGTIKIWDIDSISLLSTLIGHTGGVKALTWSPDGSKLASGSEDSTIKIWDTNVDTLINTLTGHTDKIQTLSWSPVSNRIASGSLDRTIKMWDAETADSLLTLHGHFSTVWSVSWSPDGKKIVSTDGYEIKIWDGLTGELINDTTQSSSSIGRARTVTWSPDGKSIATCGGNTNDCNIVKIWNANLDTMIRTYSNHIDQIFSICWNKDSQKIISGSYDQTINIWDTNSDTLINVLGGYNNEILSVSWNPVGDKIASGGRYASLNIFDANTGNLINTFSGHKGWILDVSWSPDGKKIASASNDSTIKLWEANTGVLLNTFRGHSALVSELSWNPDGNEIASCSWDSTIIIWDINNGDSLFTLDGHVDRVGSVSWSPDGSKIVSSAFQSIIIWDANSYDEKKKIEGFNSAEEVVWSPDGSKFSNGSVIFDASTYSYNFLDSWALSTSWSPDGSLIATSGGSWMSDYGYVKIFDSNTSDLIHELNGHTAEVESVEWNPDGKRIVSGSSDGTVRIWYIEDELQQDQSDSLFSIVAPVLTSSDVNIGLYCINETKSKTTIISDFIKNTSGYSIRVDSITVSGIDASDFSLVPYANFPDTLSDGGDMAVEFLFRPTTVGLKTADLNIYYQTGILTQQISAEAVDCGVDILNSMIDMGKVCFDETKDTLISVLRNTGISDLQIDSTVNLGPDKTQFTIINGDGAFTLTPAEEHSIQIEFVPKDSGLTNCRIAFYHTGLSSPEIIQFYAEGIICNLPSDTVIIQVGSSIKEHKPGDYFEIPIYLINGEKLNQTNVSGFTADLKFNSTILFPAEKSLLGTSYGDERVINLNIPYQTLPGNILLNIPFYATLGNDTTTTLIIENINPIGDDVQVFGESGTFTLTGVCMEGGYPRLVSMDNATGFNLIMPNPGNDKVTVEYDMIEDGHTKLYIINPLGDVIKDIVDNEVLHGTHTEDVNIKDLSTGMYFIVLETPTYRQVRKLVIMR